MREHRYYVYVLASKHRVLYIGLTNDLVMRVWQHKNKKVAGFTSKYNVDRLMYFDEFDDIVLAIAREKQLKGWKRSRKVALIEAQNASWSDLAEHGVPVRDKVI